MQSHATTRKNPSLGRRCNGLLRRRTVQAALNVVQEPQANTAAPTKPLVPGTNVSIKISIPYKTVFGKVVKAVGGAKELGMWNAQAAPPLHWSEGDVWRGELTLEPGQYEFKMIVFDTASTAADWEAGPNRVLQVPGFPGTLEVPCMWGKPEMDTRFVDAPREVTDPIEAAAQAAALVGADGRTAALLDAELQEVAQQDAEQATAEQAAKLSAARESIRETVVKLMESDDLPEYSREQLLIAAASNNISPFASAKLNAKAAAKAKPLAARDLQGIAPKVAEVAETAAALAAQWSSPAVPAVITPAGTVPVDVPSVAQQAVVAQMAVVDEPAPTASDNTAEDVVLLTPAVAVTATENEAVVAQDVAQALASDATLVPSDIAAATAAETMASAVQTAGATSEEADVLPANTDAGSAAEDVTTATADNSRPAEQPPLSAERMIKKGEELLGSLFGLLKKGRV